MAIYRPSAAVSNRGIQLPRKALRVDEAAAVIGVSRDWFVDQVLPEIEAIRRGRMTLVPTSEIDRWLKTEKVGVNF